MVKSYAICLNIIVVFPILGRFFAFHRPVVGSRRRRCGWEVGAADLLKKTTYELLKCIKQFPTNDCCFFLNYLEDSGLSENKNKWFWGSGTCPKMPKS